MFICDAGYISDGVYMGSAPCPRIGSVAKWGTEPLDATAIRENARTPIRKTQAVWESPSPISPMACMRENAQAPRCIWGVPHAPKTGRCRYSGECPNPNQKDASCLGVPKPHISDGVFLGVAQAPRCLWGVPHAPKTGRCRYSGDCPNPNQKDASCLGVPKPHISDGVYLGDAQAPWCIWGVPHTPKERRCRYSGSRTQLFTFHFLFFISLPMIPNINWNATAFFKQLTEQNKLAQEQGFKFCRVTGLQGFEEALARLQTATAIIAVDDSSQGYTDLTNSPHTRRIKTVFFAKRHAIDDMAARGRCLDTMREVFRQFMSRLILERTRLEQNAIYLDQRIQFQEIDEYFFSGCACAYFQVAVDTFTDLRFRSSEWKNLPEMGAFSPQFTQSYD